MMCLPPLCRQPVPVIVTATPCHSHSTVSQASQEDGTCACGCSSRWQKLMQNWKTQVVTLTVKQHEDRAVVVFAKRLSRRRLAALESHRASSNSTLQHKARGPGAQPARAKCHLSACVGCSPVPHCAPDPCHHECTSGRVTKAPT